MKKLFTLIAAIVGLASVANVQGDNFYAGGFGGVNWLQSTHHHNKSRVGYVLGLDAGYKWCNGFRAELEVSYRNNRLKRHTSGDVTDVTVGSNHRNNTQIWSSLINGLYSFDIDCWSLKPYVGAGIGVASHRRFQNNNDGSSSHKRKAGFAWQLIAGLEYPCDCVDIDLSYSFFRTTERSNNHGLRLGANYNF